MKKALLIAAMVASQVAMAQQHKELTLSKGWAFSRDKSQWEQVSVPHDWAIAGPFDKKWDLQWVAIEQNGEKEKSEKSGRSGALPWIGEGYYKTTITIPKGYSHAELLFDGAMSEPTVTVNGQQAAYWAYGYNAFRADITPMARFGDKENTIEVHLKNMEESSRWYPGGGIYRPVTLILTGDNHLDQWETFARTISASKDTATVAVDAKIVRKDIIKNSGAEVELFDNSNQLVAASHCNIGQDGKLSTKLTVRKPHLWTPETPYLYRLKITYKENRKAVDAQTVNIGIRTIRFSAEKGFELNGKTRKIKGVCLHHDLGPLGAAENKAALIRQIKMMKEMGCDAIRTAHNMPSKMQMDICDSLGMMVMAESFDMWIYKKCKNGYARFFKEWADKDITNLVKHHRNHPAIIMWSIGNEIPEQGMKGGTDIAKHLQDICHKLDPTRPVTQGMDRAEAAIKTGFAQAMDVPGFNYRVHKYTTSIKSLPQGFLLGSETASTVSSRGVYKFPVVISDNATYPDGQCSSYDTEYCSWSNLPDDDWKMQDDYSWVTGEFVWTGYDYLGEPTPYDTYWPSRSSYFGICDLAGLPKDRYYLYRSKWNTKEHTIHVLPHWNWQGREGQVTPVYCYTDAPEAELFVNGKSQGRIKKNKKERLDRYRLRWNDVKYEPGEIKVVAYNADGTVMGECTRKTAGKPSEIACSIECPQSKYDGDDMEIKADGNDLAFITVSMNDKDGNPCPTANNELWFEVKGNGYLEALCNGDATSLVSFKSDHMPLFSGQLVAIVKSNGKAGNIILKITDKKLKISKEVIIKSR